MAKGSSRKSSGISSAIQADKEAQTTKQPEPVQATVQNKTVGRPKEQTSKRSGIEAGTHFKINVIIPMGLYKKLRTESAQELDRDMSDIVSELLAKHYKE